MKKLLLLLVIPIILSCGKDDPKPERPYTKLTFELIAYPSGSEYIQIGSHTFTTGVMNKTSLWNLGEKLKNDPYYTVSLCGIDWNKMSKSEFEQANWNPAYIKLSAQNDNGINVSHSGGFKVIIERVGY